MIIKIKRNMNFCVFSEGCQEVTEKGPSNLYFGRTDLWSAVGMSEWHWFNVIFRSFGN